MNYLCGWGAWKPRLVWIYLKGFPTGEGWDLGYQKTLKVTWGYLGGTFCYTLADTTCGFLEKKIKTCIYGNSKTHELYRYLKVFEGFTLRYLWKTWKMKTCNSYKNLFKGTTSYRFFPTIFPWVFAQVPESKPADTEDLYCTLIVTDRSKDR